MCNKPNDCKKTLQTVQKCDCAQTINLAKYAVPPKPNMQMYDKCFQASKVVCGDTTARAVEIPLSPTSIKVCTRQEYLINKGKLKLPVCKKPYYHHGKFMYLVKAGILAGAAYWTYKQGVWGTQREATECVKRWGEYIRSINTRIPPTFDECGRVVRTHKPEPLLSPLFKVYKGIVTTCFMGLVKIPQKLKCMYMDYLKALEKKRQEDELERKLRRNSAK